MYGELNVPCIYSAQMAMFFFRVPDCKLQDRSWNDVKLFEGIAQPMTDHGTGTFTFTYTNQPFV